jgi:hypothetical protein
MRALDDREPPAIQQSDQALLRIIALECDAEILCQAPQRLHIFRIVENTLQKELVTVHRPADPMLCEIGTRASGAISRTDVERRMVC